MKSNYTRKSRFIGLLFIFSSFAVNVSAQSTLAKEKELVDSSGDRFWYTLVFVGVALLAAAFYLWRKAKKGSTEPEFSYASRNSSYYNNESYEIGDGDKELEWLRKAKKSSSA